MSYLMFKHPRTRLAGVALVAAVGIGGLASAPTALASPLPAIDSQVHRADAALRAVASGEASASADINGPLAKVTVPLGIAAKLSAQLAAHPRTPKTALAAATALTAVAREEAKAQATLNSRTGVTVPARRDAIVRADFQVTEAHRLAVDELAQLRATTHARAETLLNASVSLKAKAAILLGKLVVDTTPNTGGCPPLVFADLVAKESAKAEASVTGDAAAKAADTIDAGGSLLAALTSDEAAQVRARVSADLAAQVQSGGSLGVGGTGRIGVGDDPIVNAGIGATLGLQLQTGHS